MVAQVADLRLRALMSLCPFVLEPYMSLYPCALHPYVGFRYKVYLHSNLNYVNERFER